MYLIVTGLIDLNNQYCYKQYCGFVCYIKLILEYQRYESKNTTLSGIIYNNSVLIKIDNACSK